MDVVNQYTLLSPFKNGRSITVDDEFGSEFIKFINGPLGEPLPRHLRLPAPAAWLNNNYLLSSHEIQNYVTRFNAAVIAFRTGRFDMTWQMGRVLGDDAVQELLAMTRRVTVKGDRELEGVSIGTRKYGEMSAEQMISIVKELEMGLDDVFVDLGSGIGHLLATVALSSSVSKSVGIELVATRAKRALEFRQNLQSVLQWFGRAESMGDVELFEGSFLQQQHKDLVQNEATVVFVNNYVFEADTTIELKALFEGCQVGTRIISTAPFVTERDQQRQARQLRDALPAKVRLSKLRTTPRNNGFRSASCDLFMMTIIQQP